MYLKRKKDGGRCLKRWGQEPRTVNGEMSAGFREWIRLNKMEQRTFPLRLDPCEDKRLVIIFAENANALKRITVCSYPGKMGQNAMAGRGILAKMPAPRAPHAA